MPHSQLERIGLLKSAIEKRILVLDGAMGTQIQNQNLTAKDFGGEAYDGCNEYLCITRPEVISSIHDLYFQAGCDIVETNTFGGTPLVLGEFQLEKQFYEINRVAAELARKSAAKFSTSQKPRFVAGSVGPTTKAISVTGGVTFEELIENFYQQALGLIDGGVDYFLVETCQDTRNIKAAILGIQKANQEKSIPIPIAVSGTIEAMGTMLAGQPVEALATSLAHLDLLYLGLNCATGPEFMTDPIRSLAEMSKFRISCVPNAGLPDENGKYLESPEMMAQVLERFLQKNWVNVLGGCCGTTEKHIAKFSELASHYAPPSKIIQKRSFLSGVDFLEVVNENRPYLVGERTNVIGSKKFKTLICEEKFEEASEIAKAQVKKGAHIIDVCLANPDRNEIEDMQRFLEPLIKKTKAPLMIDSTDEKVVELALTYCQGKAIINSINLEDGEERFEKIVPLAKQFGAALVVGTIDEDPQQGMGVTRERKIAIAKRSFELLTKKYQFPEEDIYFDPLVFPVGTGDENYIGSALETIEGIRLIKKQFPFCKTVLGISNVSFGLPNSGREILNSVFLYHCVQSGLDLAIVNSEKLVRFNQIPEKEITLSENLLFNRNPNAVQEFASHFRSKKNVVKANEEKLPLEQRLPRYVVEGSKDGLVSDLEEALKNSKPMDIINGPLMKGMDEVGKLFNENKLIVAEVLQSAEVMKAAVSFLEPFMEKKESSTRGKIVLATVKGDVHDIGKNLVDIILSNNGFEVINLGIKIPPEQLIQAIAQHDPDMVGLSGLLVKSAQQMVVTAEDLSKAGINTPILVGGAALTSNFVDKQISKAYGEGVVAYASDAMHGLELAKTIVDPESLKKLKSQLEEKRKNLVSASAVASASAVVETLQRSKIVPLETPPAPPDFDRHVLLNQPDIETIWKYLNPMMLYGRHLGISGQLVRLLTQSQSKHPEREIEKLDAKAYGIWQEVENVKQLFKSALVPSSVFQFFHCKSNAQRIEILDGEGRAFATFDFPRQKREPFLCLADYVNSKKDALCFFAVTVGKNIRALAEKLKNEGNYLHSHILQAVAIESAEAYAEYLHGKIRSLWGFPDSLEITLLEKFQAKYHGKRYSFGYPACPNLSDQQKLFQLIRPQDIGIELTDGDMMEPEASVSALVFHHPQAQYFSVGQGLDQ